MTRIAKTTTKHIQIRNIIRLFALLIVTTLTLITTNSVKANPHGETAIIYMPPNNNLISEKPNSLLIDNGEIFIILGNGKKIEVPNG